MDWEKKFVRENDERNEILEVKLFRLFRKDPVGYGSTKNVPYRETRRTEKIRQAHFYQGLADTKHKLARLIHF